MNNIKELQKQVHDNKVKKNFNVTNIENEFLLLYGEVSESYEAYRKKLPDLGEELADIVIYTLGLSEILNIDLEKEERIAERQAQDTKYKSVTNFQKGTADANWYFTTNEPEGFSDDEKKALGQKVGSEISDYDNMLSSEATRRSVTPAVAQGYYTKVLDLPNVYTADPEFKFGDTTTWGTDAAFSENNFKEALDTVFNRGGKVVKAQDVAMYSKLDLIIPMITKVTINGKTGVLTPESVAKLRLKYSK